MKTIKKPKIQIHWTHVPWAGDRNVGRIRTYDKEES